jgi:DNA invertase Pin-like site-specific DNA recombinase
MVWKLDRLGRSLHDLIEIVNDLDSRGVGFASLSEAIDTTTANGKLFFHIFGALAEFERSLTVERTKAGLEAAKRRGKRGGRPNALTADQVAHAGRMIKSNEQSVSGMADILNVNRKTLHRALKASGIK